MSKGVKAFLFGGKKEVASTSSTAVTSNTGTREFKDGGDEKVLSKTEQDALKKIFELLVKDEPGVLQGFDKLVGSGEHDELCQVLINFSSLTGYTLHMIRYFILEEFKNSKEDPGSIMRGNCIASKMTKFYLQKIGRGYLKDVLGGFITSLESERSMEVDPNKTDKLDDVEANKNLLLNRLRDIVQTIVSNDAIFKMPIEIKVISSYFAEFANQYAPDQFYSLVGGFLFLRYINPALIFPALYDLWPEQKQLPPAMHRNLVLISKALQNLSNGLQFGQKEEYMMFLNDFLRANEYRIEKYFKTIVAQSSQATPTVDPNAATESDYEFLHNLLTSKKRRVLDLITEPEVKEQFEKLVETLSQYRHINNFLTKEWKTDPAAVIRITVETGGQVFEHTVSGTVTSVQPLAQLVMDKVTKYDQKTQKKLAKTKQEKPDSTVFGKKLEVVMDQQKLIKPHLKIPEFIQEAIGIILLKGLSDEGIFRQSGDKNVIEHYRQDIDKGEKINFSTEKNIHNLTGLIKLYLTLLPGSILTHELYEFVRIFKKENPGQDEYLEQREKTRGLIKDLPVYYRDLLDSLVHLLWQVSINSKRNLMTAQNLSVAFGPTLVKTSSASNAVDALQEASVTAPMIRMMIEEYPFLFREFIELEESKQIFPMWKQRIIAHDKSVQFLVQVGNMICTTAAGIIGVWNVENGSNIRFMSTGAAGPILYMIAIDENIWCATESVIQVWDPACGEMVGKIDIGGRAMARYNSQVWIFAIWPPNQKKPPLCIFDIKTWKCLETLQTSDNVLLLEAIDDTIWGSNLNGGFSVWSPQNFQLIKDVPTAHKRKITAILHVDQHVWTGADDATICVWKKGTYELVRKLETNASKIKSLGYWNGQVWCGSWDMSIKIYSGETYEQIHELKNQHTDAISKIHFIYNNNKQAWYAWTASYDHTFSIWFVPDPRSKHKKSIS